MTPPPQFPPALPNHAVGKCLIVVRHCEATGQEPDAPLTARGMEQAADLASFLAEQPLDAVVASEFLRARQSAQPLADSRGIPLAVDSRLNERKLSAGPISNWREVVRDSFVDPDLRAPGGETASEVLCRAWGCLSELLVGESGPAVAVTHGNLASLVLHSIDSSFGYEGWESLSNPDVYLLECTGTRRLKFQRIWTGRY